MENEIHQLLELASRVRRGESGAAQEFRQALEPYLRCVVRLALRPGARPTATTCRVQAEANGVPDRAAEGDALAEEMARLYCARAIGRLQPTCRGASPLADTVVN